MWRRTRAAGARRIDGRTTRHDGQLRIHQCTGTSKNASGLSMEVFPPKTCTADPVLLRRMRVMVTCPAAHRVRSTQSPVRITADDRTLRMFRAGRPNPMPGSCIHTPNNSYKHPLSATYIAHDSAAWLDARITGRSPPYYVRNTEDRTGCGLGHIGFDWGTISSPSSAPCGGACQLDIQQY
jgi:hypothetical protein